MRTVLLMAHLIAIAVGTGLSFANYINLRHGAAETGERAAALAGLRRIYGRIGDVVVTLIWLTGLALLWAWIAQGGPAPGGWFHAKLAFVVLLTVCHAMARHTSGRMARTGDVALRGRIELFVVGVWVSALASIALAVMTFS